MMSAVSPLLDAINPRVPAPLSINWWSRASRHIRAPDTWPGSHHVTALKPPGLGLAPTDASGVFHLSENRIVFYFGLNGGNSKIRLKKYLRLF